MHPTSSDTRVLTNKNGLGPDGKWRRYCRRKKRPYSWRSALSTCPICRKAKHLVEDHKKGTPILRGRICNNCNLILGHAKDDADVLRRAIAYLEVADD